MNRARRRIQGDERLDFRLRFIGVSIHLTLHIIRGGQQVLFFQHVVPTPEFFEECVKTLGTSIAQVRVERYPHKRDEVFTAAFDLVDTLWWFDASFDLQRYRGLGRAQRQMSAVDVSESPQRERFKQSPNCCQVHRG
jgi:hypothetical protein